MQPQKSAKSVLKNLFFQLIIKFVAMAAGIIISRWLVSNLGDKDLADYNIIFAYTAIILSMINFGIPNLVQKFFTNPHKTEEIGIFWTSITLIRVASYFVGIALILLSFGISQTDRLLLTLGIFTIQFILVYDLNYRSLWDAKGTPWKFSLTDLISKVLVLTFLFVVPRYIFSIQLNIQYFVIVSGIAYFTTLVIDTVWNRENYTFGKINLSFIKANTKTLTYLSLTMVLIALWTTTDKLLLKYFGGSEYDIVSYSNAYKILETALVIPGLTMPTVSSYVKKCIDNGKTTKIGTWLQQKFKLNKTRSILSEWLLVIFVISIFTTILMVLVSSALIHLIDKDLKYGLSLSITPPLLLAIIPIFFLQFLSSIVIFFDGEKGLFAGAFVTLFLTILFYITLIPAYGVWGAVYGTIFCYCVDLSTKVYCMNRVLKRSDTVS
jgi:O-antigen/teichoic acid export membrane protein